MQREKEIVKRDRQTDIMKERKKERKKEIQKERKKRKINLLGTMSSARHPMNRSMSQGDEYNDLRTFQLDNEMSEVKNKFKCLKEKQILMSEVKHKCKY